MEVLLVKTGNRLAAADPISDETISGMKEGETVKATLRRSRNVRHHRKLFKLLSIIFRNQSMYPTVEDLLDALKLATGLFDECRALDGSVFLRPQSISFSSMDQTRFEQWYESVIEVVVTKVLPNMSREDLIRQVNEML